MTEFCWCGRLLKDSLCSRHKGKEKEVRIKQKKFRGKSTWAREMGLSESQLE